MQTQDKIFIQDLLLRCIIGINPDERTKLQDVVINLELATDTRQAGQTDNIEDAVDYKSLNKQIISMVEDSKYYLVETLAAKIAGTCLEHPQVSSAKVKVAKPGALRFAQTVGVEIVRTRDEV